jgi:ribosome-associated protein
MTTESATKKNTQKLQRAIVDGLENVKGNDIKVFDTEHLSSLFERVIIASGTSNRQTRALAGAVRDAVKEAGFPKPRMEGEENGEWIIVDCGQAVVHIMQPGIRTYYNLEEIWGDKAVRLKLGAPKPESRPVAKKVAAPAVAARMPGKSAGAKTAAKTPAKPTGKSAAAPAAKTRPAARKAATAAPAPKPPAAKKSAPAPLKVVKVVARKSPAKKSAVAKTTRAPSRKS